MNLMLFYRPIEYFKSIVYNLERPHVTFINIRIENASN